MFSAAAVATLLQPQCTEKTFPAALPMSGGVWRQIFNSLFQFDRLVLPLLSRTTRNPFSAAESKCELRSCLCLHASTLPLIPLQHVSSHSYLHDFTVRRSCPWFRAQYAPLSLRPLTCEVKAGHRWGPREQGCIQFQHARAKRGFFFFFGHEFTLGEVPPVIVPFITTRRLSDATMSRWHLRYVPDVIGMHQVGPGDGRPSSCSADSLRGPILLAGFVLSPSPGPNRKTAKGRDPALYISFNEVTSSPRWCFCTSKLPLFLVCASIKIYVSQHLIFAHWSPGHEAEVMNIKQQKACGSYPSRRPLLHFFLFTTASK